MASPTLNVTFTAEDSARLPGCLSEGAATLVDLQGRGLLAMLGDKLHIRRQGGFSGLDVWVMLWLYMASGMKGGLKKFWELARPHKKGLAALAGRRRLASSSSLSRALGAVEPDLLRECSSWLLTGLPEVDGVLRHPAVQTYDALGQGWHVFDVDPTVTTLRHRALPAGEDLPEPMRDSAATGKPGYKGRKRGDIIFRRATGQHAGSGVWIHAHLNEGNGDSVGDFARVLDSIRETSERLDHPLSRTLVRMDGEHGNVPWFAACRERGLPFVTRLNRPKLYSNPEVLKTLRTATWTQVEDSGSGPVRAAADVGVLTIQPGKKTTRPDGTAYDPVVVRVVASIFPNDGEAKRGRVLDGWQVELFAVDLPADAWSAADAITAYFGRNGEENRFAQEDRELGLDRIISYHLPGQELAALVGLSLWNLRLARGFALERPPDVRPVQQLRRPQIDDRVPESWPRDPVVLRVLDQLDWPDTLATWPGWTFDRAALRCPEGRPLDLTTVRTAEHAVGRTGLVFRRPVNGCADCGKRTGCFHSVRARAAKHAEISVPTEVAAVLRDRLALVRTRAEPTIAAIKGAPSALDVRDSLFLPAEARKVFQDVFKGATVRVHVVLPPPDPPRPRLVASDTGDRQRRRKTWQQNLERYALPSGAKVQLEVSGTPPFRRMFSDQDSMKTEGGARA